MTELSTEIDFPIQGTHQKITVLTRRPDTIFGVSYLALEAEHSMLTLLKDQILNWDEIESYIETADNVRSSELANDQNKLNTGIQLAGVLACNPATGGTVPVWTANYVSSVANEGAIMGVPAHNEQDFIFAKKFNLPIKEVVQPCYGQAHDNEETRYTITAVVRRPSDNKFLLVFQKQLGHISPVIGGIDPGETPEQAAEREVREETGYRTQALQKLGSLIESHFYAKHKQVWRERFDQPVLLKLLEEKPQAVSAEEAATQEPVWLTYEELKQQLPYENNIIPFIRAVEGHFCYTGTGLLINSGEYSGWRSSQALPAMAQRYGRLV